VAKFKREAGFTLPEVLITMALISIISLVVMGALEPWIAFKNKLDTERRLQDVKTGMVSLYENNGMAIEAQPAQRFMTFVSSAPAAGPDGALRCEPQRAAFETHGSVFSESPAQVSQDGYANPWCLMISPPIRELRDGVSLWFRNVGIVSTGADGALDPATQIQADGSMVMGGDDLATTVVGRDVQGPKLKETLRRLNRVAQFYENYFTAQYLGNPARDISTYYFSTGAVASTNGTWTPVGTALLPIGLGGAETVTPWESANAIEMDNFNQIAGGVRVRSPSTSGTGVLPYTALLRARVPSPAGAPEYAIQTAVGNY